MKKEKELSEKRGTIANVFNKHRDELFNLIAANRFKDLQLKVNSLLDDPKLEDNPATDEARRVLEKCSKKQNLYYSTLMTYLTGMKVSV